MIQSEVVSPKYMYLRATLSGLSKSYVCVCVYVCIMRIIKEDEVLNVRRSKELEVENRGVKMM